MTPDLTLLWIIQLAPLAAFAAIQLLPARLKQSAPWVAVGLAGLAAWTSLKILLLHLDGGDLPLVFAKTWLEVADRGTFTVGFLADRLNLLMICLVTTITFFVQLFSVYYMEDDSAKPRYFAFLSFFAFSMSGLVLSSNLLQTYLFWELVGLASYLLIGFWHEKHEAATAARKAFVINRLGDLGFYLGLILLFLFFGSLDFLGLDSQALQNAIPPAQLTLIGVLLLLGVMGKSAQFPFHVWLPDAMEGPTPVSALIHSATMVAAGVFLLSRCFGLFSASETTLLVVLWVGTLTAFVGAAVATVQRDIKKILAYSTISQLGLMVMALGASSAVAGMFHLSTHAFFKALLFLAAGAFIHQFHTNDIWEIGRLGGKKNALAMVALCLGLFSLCGIFPFSGFFSKDLILEGLRERSFFFYAAALGVSFLTVYYSFRLLWVIAFSKIRRADHTGHPESPVLEFCRALPLLSLAGLSLVMGSLGTAWTGYPLLAWLGGHPVRPSAEILVMTTLLILGGAALAYRGFRNPDAAYTRLEETRNFLKTLLVKKFYMDDAYQFLVKKIALRLAALLDWFDKNVINGLMVNQTSFSVMRLGRVAARLQNGYLQDYLSLAVGLMVVIIYWVVG